MSNFVYSEEALAMWQRNPGAPIIYDLASRCTEILHELKQVCSC